MPVVVGYEVAGRVDKVGAGADQSWMGRDVLAMTRFGGYTDVVCVPQKQVYARPSGMSASEGAALPVNYITAYQLIEVMGGLRSGDTMLVHSAGGGVGIAATQLAKNLKAKVIGTASRSKHDFLRSIGVDHLIDYRSEDFESRVREITGGKGVELILDAVGGESWAKGLRVLAPTGRLGMFGMSSAAAGKTRSIGALLKTLKGTPWLRFMPPRLINENKGVFGVNVGHLWNEMDRVRRWIDTLLDYYRAGVVKPVIAATFPLERAAEAHHYIQDRRNIGKVLLTTA
jgi:NADPH:quinone reductase-like Zn-dependent oxidoreductase